MTDSKELRAELLKYMWPHPYPESHPPIQVTFSNGLPESDDDPIHKVFVIPFALFEKAVQEIVAARVAEGQVELLERLIDTGYNMTVADKGGDHIRWWPDGFRDVLFAELEPVLSPIQRGTEGDVTIPE